MNREWVHKKYQISPWEKCATADSASPAIPTLCGIKLSTGSILCAFVGLICFLAIPTLIVSFSHQEEESIFDTMTTPFVIQGPSLESFNKKTVLAKMSFKKKAEYNKRILFLTGKISEMNKKVDASKMASKIVYQSHIAHYDPIFVAAVIHAESNFRKNAKSPVGARGLMQLMPNTAKDVCKLTNTAWHDVNKLEDPEYNIFLGISYLKFLGTEFYGHNYEEILIAYNWGPGKLNRAKARGTSFQLPRETSRYKHKILTLFDKWKKEYADFEIKLPQIVNPDLKSNNNQNEQLPPQTKKS